MKETVCQCALAHIRDFIILSSNFPRVNSLLNFRLPSSPILFLSSGCEIRYSIFSASARLSCFSVRKPFSPSSIMPEMPPSFVETHGTPCCIASSNTKG